MDDETHFFVRLCAKCVKDEKTQIRGMINSYNKFLHLDPILKEFQENTTKKPVIQPQPQNTRSSTRTKKKVNYREDKKEYFIDHDHNHNQTRGQIVNDHLNRNKLFLTLQNTNRTFMNDNNDDKRLLPSNFCYQNSKFTVPLILIIIPTFFRKLIQQIIQ